MQKPSVTRKELLGWTQSSLRSLGTSLGHVGNTLANGLSALTTDSTDKERITLVKFGELEYTPSKKNGIKTVRRTVLLVGYVTGFQLWDIDSGAPNLLVSRREGPVRFLEVLPLPQKDDTESSPLHGMRPCLAIVPVEGAQPTSPSATAQESSLGSDGLESAGSPGLVQLYTLRTHSVIRTLTFTSRVLSVRASPRLLIVALDAQVMAFDASTLQRTFSVVTYPAPCTRQLVDGERPAPGTAVPLALGPRWLAYASNQAVSGCAVPHSILPASTRPAAGRLAGYESVGGYARAAAKTGGKQLLGLGEAGFKYVSSQVGQWRSGSWEGASARESPREEIASGGDAEVVGTVMVRDVVTRQVVAHFRAHTAPLLLLQWDGSGTLLVTASVHGHNINIFQVSPMRADARGSRGGAVHLMRLMRGLTPATIQNVAFSACGTLLSVSSARGTTHIYRLALPGASENVAPHLAAALQASGGGAQAKVQRLGAVGRVRHTGILNGVIPGSSAAAAAVNLYNGSSGTDLVAATFLGRQKDSRDSTLMRVDAAASASHAALEDLYVVHSDGLLLRHRLQLSAAPHEMADEVLGSSYGSTPDSVLCSAEDGLGEVAVDAEEQWDLCRRTMWAEREEELVEPAARGSGGTEEEREERRIWMANAETALSSPARPHLWADGQFHILEMQTSKPPPSPTTRKPAGDRASGAEAASTPLQSSSILQVEAVPTRRLNVMRSAAASPVTTDAAGIAVVRKPLRVPDSPR